MKIKFRKTFLILGLLFALNMFCGCDLFAQLDLSEEESGLIAEYAAGLLRKYDTNSKLKELVTDEAEPVEETLEEAAEEPSEELPEEPVEEAKEEPDFFDITEGITDTNSDGEPVYENETEVSISSISELVNTPDCDISYLGYELCDKYPDNADNEWLISMAAADGKKLCVLDFEITGNSGGDVVCNILDSGKSYRLIVNGSEKINESVTVLMDSFSQFNEVIPAGESKKAVLIFELDNELADSINSLDLIIKDKNNSDTVSLQ